METQSIIFKEILKIYLSNRQSQTFGTNGYLPGSNFKDLGEKTLLSMGLGRRQVIGLCLLTNSYLLILKRQLLPSSCHRMWVAIPVTPIWLYQARGLLPCSRWFPRFGGYPAQPPTLAARETEGHTRVSSRWSEGWRREQLRYTW